MQQGGEGWAGLGGVERMAGAASGEAVTDGRVGVSVVNVGEAAEGVSGTSEEPGVTTTIVVVTEVEVETEVVMVVVVVVIPSVVEVTVFVAMLVVVDVMVVVVVACSAFLGMVEVGMPVEATSAVACKRDGIRKGTSQD